MAKKPSAVERAANWVTECKRAGYWLTRRSYLGDGSTEEPAGLALAFKAGWEACAAAAKAKEK